VPGQEEGIPVIMLTARAEEAGQVGRHRGGGPRLITKPFAPRELLARIQACCGARTAGADRIVEADGLKMRRLEP